MTNDKISVPQNSNLAIISLISGILGLTFLPLIGSIIAVITAPMAKKEINESEGMLTGEDMAKVGQILGWVGIVLLGSIACCCLAFLALVIILIPGLIIPFSIEWSSLLPGLVGLLF